MSRSPRIAYEPIQYKDWVIPPGVSRVILNECTENDLLSIRQTPVSESIYFVHWDPTLFPEPSKFRPERWIKAQETGFRLEKYMICFSRGSRSCLGIK